MQSQGKKIANLSKAKGLKMIGIVKHIGWTKAGFSRKVNSDQRFDPKTLSEIAAYLGVTPEYLRDESRPFNPGDPIPADALAQKPTPITDTPTDLAAQIARLMERQALDMARVQQERQALDIEVLKESDRQMAELLNQVAGNLLAVSEIVRELKEERDGSHDPD